MAFTPFDLEYTQSVRKQKLDINFTGSGFRPSLPGELPGRDGMELVELQALT